MRSITSSRQNGTGNVAALNLFYEAVTFAALYKLSCHLIVSVQCMLDLNQDHRQFHA